MAVSGSPQFASLKGRDGLEQPSRRGRPAVPLAHAVFDHRGEDRLHVFGNHGVAADDQRPGARRCSRPIAARGERPTFNPEECRVCATSAWT